MKKLLSISSTKILIFCAFGLMTTLGAFWHHQSNQRQLEQMNTLNQGVGTCFNRISQTFTALMIKDIQSPYLNRGFMGLSDECLNETIKGINPFKQNVGKGYQTLNKLISDVHWFHESVVRAHSPMLAGKEMNTPLNPLSSKFSQMEALKVNLVDEIDMTNSRIKEVLANDEVLLGIGLMMFVLAICGIALKEYNRLQIQREIENQALNLLRANQANVGAMVDNLVVKGLQSNGLNVTAQIFKDYHGDLLERSAGKVVYQESKSQETPDVESNTIVEKIEKYEGPKTSFKEVLLSLENINSKDLIQANDVREVSLAVAFESFEQMVNAAVNKLASRRTGQKKIMISNQVHSDKAVVSLFLAGSTFTATELEFSHNNQTLSVDAMDMNMIILREMANETESKWHIENKTDRNGEITGMLVRFTVNRVPKDAKSAKNLISVFKGKKKDFNRELAN